MPKYMIYGLKWWPGIETEKSTRVFPVKVISVNMIPFRHTEEIDIDVPVSEFTKIYNAYVNKKPVKVKWNDSGRVTIEIKQ